MRITTRTLLNIDRLFFPIQRVLEFISSKPKGATSNQVVAIKLKGKGSIVRFIQLCEQANADLNELILVTFAYQRDVCEWLQIKNVLYIRTTNIFCFFIDCWRIFQKIRGIKPRVIVSLERCSHAVNAFGLFLSLRGNNRIILFEPTQRLVSDKILIHSANTFSLAELFKTAMDELPKASQVMKLQKVEIVRNKIIININASDLLSSRRYSIEGFADIIKGLYQCDASLEFVLVGSAVEHDYVEQLVQLLKNIPVKNSAGHLSFRALANEFASASFVLTGDSLALHLAAYLHVPVVALWGPTQPSHFGYSRVKNIHSVTLNLHCSPCFIHSASKPAAYCKGRIDCLSQLRSNQVLEICKEVLVNNSIERDVNFPVEAGVQFKPKFAF